MAIQLPPVGAPTAMAPPAQRSKGNGTSQTDAPPDEVTLGQAPGADVTYADPRAQAQSERPDLTSLLADSKQKVEEFMAFLRPLLAQQGLSIEKVVRGEQKISVDAQTVEKAKADIAEDGEWGVRKTAGRILDFARFGMGGDPAKIEVFRAAIQKGFDEAQAMLGGTLPEISQQTHQAIMDELDRWRAHGIPEGAISVSPPTPAETKAA